MQKGVLFVSGMLVCWTVGCTFPQETSVIWQIGVEDGNLSEFALAPDQHEEFLGHNFGREDRFDLMGKSLPEKDFPYVLPDPADRWDGTSGTAGLRTHTLNILFGMERVPNN